MALKDPFYRPTAAVIHLENLSHNLSQLRTQLSAQSFFCPMIKANAYGHGDVLVGRHLEKMGVKTFGVGLVEEGILLRQAGISTEMIVFGAFDQEALREMIRWKLTPVITSKEQLESFEGLERGQIPVHIKFDTGMNRLGLATDEAQEILEWLADHPQILVKGILTHLHSAENLGRSQSESLRQLMLFQPVIEIFRHLNPMVHSLNSAGTLHEIRRRQKNEKWPPGIDTAMGVRPGLAIYGYSPLAAAETTVSLKPAMSWRSRIVKIRKIKAKETVSYGASWSGSRPTLVGVVPCGYADGYHRILSNNARVLFQGQKVPVIGKVCMDYFMIDVTDVIQGKDVDRFVGEEVTLFGYDSQGQLLPASELASQAQTIPWEILTSVGERVPRVLDSETVLSPQMKAQESQR